LPLDCEIFSLNADSAALFILRDSWTFDEAALLLTGANPRHIKKLDADPNIYKPDYWTCGYPAFHDLLTNAFESGALAHPCKPRDIVAWAAGKGLVIPAPLLPLVPTAPAQNTTTTAPVVTGQGTLLETVERRRARYLEWFTEEEKIAKLGALQRVFQREQKQNPNADRSNIGKDIKKARAVQTERKRAGHWEAQLVQGGKRPK
jgi:hypothetical protein